MKGTGNARAKGQIVVWSGRFDNTVLENVADTLNINDRLRHAA